jgi:hypothetical protein
MILSPDYKRFKRINFTGDTFTLPDVRSSIIRNLQGCNQQQNTANLWRLKKQTQNKGNANQKTDRIITVYDRALFTLPYADTVIITGHVARPDGYVLHGQVFKKSKLYPIIEMMPFMVFYSYERKYHKLASMNIPGYQCSNIYIDVEKGALMNKDKQ